MHPVDRPPETDKRCGWMTSRLPTCGDVEANTAPPRVPAQCGACSSHIAPPEFLLEVATGRLEPLDPAVESPDGRQRRWWEIGNGWPVWRCTRCLHTLLRADVGLAVETHLQSCRFWPTQGEVCLTRSVLGPDALTPLPRPIPPTPDPPSPTGQGSLAKYRDVEPNPGLLATDPRGALRKVQHMDTALLAPGIRGHFDLRPDPPGQSLWWCTRSGMS